jgi:hypothetical protein
MENNTNWPTQKFTCPHCHAISAFDCIFSIRGLYQGNYYPISVWSCHNCNRAIFVRQKTADNYYSKNQFDIESILPATQPIVDNRIPGGIAADFIEASKDYNIASYKSAAVMARRTIQKMCLNLGATKGKNLYEQIGELEKSGKLHPDLASMATEIRFLGNDGAHPEDDSLDEISPEDAEEIINFTAELLDDLYVRPEKVAAMKSRRETKPTITP